MTLSELHVRRKMVKMKQHGKFGERIDGPRLSCSIILRFISINNTRLPETLFSLASYGHLGCAEPTLHISLCPVACYSLHGNVYHVEISSFICSLIMSELNDNWLDFSRWKFCDTRIIAVSSFHSRVCLNFSPFNEQTKCNY